MHYFSRLSLVCTLALLFTPFCLFGQFSDDDDYYDNSYVKSASQNSIYNLYGTGLFEQTQIIETPEFKDASFDQKQQILEDYFNKKRLEAYFESMKMSAINGLLVVPLAIGVYALRKPLRQIPSYIGLSGAMAFNSGIMSFGRGCYKNGQDLINAIERIYFSSSAKSELDTFEIEYVRNKPWIEEPLQAAIEKVFIEAHAHNEIPKSYLEQVKLILSLPRKPKEITYNRDHINAKLLYPKDALLSLKRYCIRHAAASTAASVRKVAAYFWGAPGVGKTRAAKLVAEVLGVPFQLVSLGDISVKDLEGTKNKPGLLLEALCKVRADDAGLIEGRNPKNIIILFDDADRTLLNKGEYGLVSFILTLLESETKTFYSKFLEAEIDISRLGIILAGNAELDDQALKSRLEIVHFKGHSADYKKRVMWEELLPSILETHKFSAFPLTMSDLLQEDIDHLNTLVDEDSDQGFRSIKRKVMNYLEDKVLCKYFGSGEEPEVCFRPVEIVDVMSSTANPEHFQGYSEEGDEDDDI